MPKSFSEAPVEKESFGQTCSFSFHKMAGSFTKTILFDT